MKALLIGILSVGLLVTTASAATIVEWPVSTCDTTDLTASTVATHVSASHLLGEPAANRQHYTSYFIMGNWYSAGHVGERDPAKYIGFSITPDSGWSIAYDQISYAVCRGASFGPQGPESWELRASTDAFASDDRWISTADISSAPLDVGQPQANSLSSVLGTQSGTVTFRLYGYNSEVEDGSNGDWSGMQGYNVLVTGSVIPEPTTMIMLAFAGLATIYRLRRRS
jgi:hypothetical protein